MRSTFVRVYGIRNGALNRPLGMEWNIDVELNGRRDCIRSLMLNFRLPG